MADRGKMDLSEQAVRQLLTDLGEDDELRSRFEENPAGVLKQRGIDFDPGQVPERSTLPPKDEIRTNVGNYVRKYEGRYHALLPFGKFVAE